MSVTPAGSSGRTGALPQSSAFVSARPAQKEGHAVGPAPTQRSAFASTAQEGASRDQQEAGQQVDVRL